MPFVPDSPVEMPDGTLRCQQHGLEICGICCCDYTFMRDGSEEQEEANDTKQESDGEEDEVWRHDSPVEMPDGTLRCQRHGLEICGICCRDYTFMRDVLKESEESNNTKHKSDEEDDKEDDEDDDEDWAPYEEEQSGTKMKLCNVCSKECQKKCSRCKNVFCECEPLPPRVVTKHPLPLADCGPEHQKQVREE